MYLFVFTQEIFWHFLAEQQSLLRFLRISVFYFFMLPYNLYCMLMFCKLRIKAESFNSEEQLSGYGLSSSFFVGMVTIFFGKKRRQKA